MAPLAEREKHGQQVVAALATSVQVFRVGDSGARAAWGTRIQSSR